MFLLTSFPRREAYLDELIPPCTIHGKTLCHTEVITAFHEDLADPVQYFSRAVFHESNSLICSLARSYMD